MHADYVLGVRKLWRALLLVSLAFACKTDQASARQSDFQQIDDQVVLVTGSSARELIGFSRVEGTWTPSRAQVMIALEFLRSPAGRAELTKLGAPEIGVGSYLDRLQKPGGFRFQVFGTVSKGRRQLFIHCFPSEAHETNWKSKVLLNTASSTTGFWWACYDYRDQFFMSCGEFCG